MSGKKIHTHMYTHTQFDVWSGIRTTYVMAHFYNHRLRTEPGRLQIWSQPAHSKFEARWGYIMKPLSPNKEEKKERKKMRTGLREERWKGGSGSDGRYDKWQEKWDIPAFPTSQQFALYFCKYKAVPWQHKLCSAPRFIWALTSIWDWGCQQPFTDSTVTTLYLNVREITVSQRFGIWQMKGIRARNRQTKDGKGHFKNLISTKQQSQSWS